VHTLLTHSQRGSNAHVPSHLDTNGQLSSHTDETCSNGHIPSLATGDVSLQQTCQAVTEPNGQLPPHLHLPCSENNGHITSFVTEISGTLASDINGHIPSSATGAVERSCHPLCSCDRCLQVVSSDTADVYCRNERGWARKCQSSVHYAIIYLSLLLVKRYKITNCSLY